MKLSKYVINLFVIQSILFVSGCNKIGEWGKKNFKQAKRYDDAIVQHMSPYIRSTIVYEQLTTIADFSALFLTDAARMLYVDYRYYLQLIHYNLVLKDLSLDVMINIKI